MKKIREDLFVDELKTQLNFALISIKEINTFLNSLSENRTFNEDFFWYYAQNLIVYSGNISKILWGVYPKGIDKLVKNKRLKERKELREKIGVNENTVLRNRYLRNSLEHIDEKLEEFTKKESTIILNKNIGPILGMIQLGNDPYDISKEKNLRHYDQETKIFYFYGESINLQELYKDIIELKEQIRIYEKK